VKTLAIAVLTLFGCNEQLAPTVTGLQSLEVTVTDPTPDKLGTPENPVNITALTYDVRAVDAQGQTFTGDLDVDVYISFAGNKIGQFTPCGDHEDSTPLETIHLKAGALTGHTTMLPRAYGVTTLWLEVAPLARSPMNPPSYAAGTSPDIYFANPTIPEVQTPLDLASPTATYCSPFNGKHVIVDHATGNGKLVVTSVFIDSFVVADTGALYDSTSGMGGFNHLYVYSFGKPDAAIVPGRIMSDVSGNVAKFVGFTELNFPLQDYPDTVDPQLLPPVYTLGAGDAGNESRLIRLSGATVKVTGKLCPIDQTANDWLKFNSFTVDLGNGVCDPFSTFAIALPAKIYGDLNPLLLTPAKTMVTATGMLRNFSGQNDATMPPTDCHTDNDCTLPPPMGANLAGTTCIEGSCKKGPYNFWQLNPRDPTDVCGYDANHPCS